MFQLRSENCLLATQKQTVRNLVLDQDHGPLDDNLVRRLLAQYPVDVLDHELPLLHKRRRHRHADTVQSLLPAQLPPQHFSCAMELHRCIGLRCATATPDTALTLTFTTCACGAQRCPRFMKTTRLSRSHGAKREPRNFAVMRRASKNGRERT